MTTEHAPTAPPTLCPHCGIDLARFEPGTERFCHLLDCSRAHGDPDVERRRQEANAEALMMLPHGALGNRRHDFGQPQPEAPSRATTPTATTPKKFTRR